MENELVRFIQERFRANQFLFELSQNIDKIEVKMRGKELFEDVFVEDIKIHLRSRNGDFVVDNPDDFFVKYVKMRLEEQGKTSDWQTFDIRHPELNEEAEQATRLLRVVESEEFNQKVFDYYIDYIHDYATAEIKDFVLEPKKTP